MKNKKSKLQLETLVHSSETRRNIPTAEYQSIMDKEAQEAIRVAYERRNRDLDPQLVWREGHSGLVGSHRAGTTALHSRKSPSESFD